MLGNQNGRFPLCCSQSLWKKLCPLILLKTIVLFRLTVSLLHPLQTYRAVVGM